MSNFNKKNHIIIGEEYRLKNKPRAISYFLWYLKYRIRLSNIFTKFWWKDRFYNIKDSFFYLKYKIPKYTIWGISPYISEQILKTLWWMGKETHGYPNDFADLPEIEASRIWSEIIHKIRFAHFYVNFIIEDPFGWMIESVEDRTNCLTWAKKKFWYAEDFLTAEFFENMFTNESLKYTLNMNFHEKEKADPVCPKGTKFITIETIEKATGKVVEIDSSITHPARKIEQDLLLEYEEGMNLFSKYYQNLWD